MNNINKIIKHSINKALIITILLTLVFYVLFNLINVKNAYAAQTRENYSSRIDNYPGYRELIENLKATHPNWKFTILYTGLDWSQVIKNESSAVHGRNVVPASKSDAWKCASCGNTPRGGSSWRCASEMAVAYYMDPRNWLNESYIFEFENLSFNDEIQTIDGVKKIISGIGYMNVDNKVTYTNTNGDTETLDKTYAEVIMGAAREAGISPYHLASRIRQEQGAGSRPGSTATGTYGGYVGYYNFLNIRASGSTDSEVIANGLSYARENGWTDPEKSIIAGAKMLANNYITDGQDTLYLQKFDVDNSDGALYWHQYMQNASAAVTEGAQVRKTYNELGLLNSSIEFIIPVYENMPDQASKEPIDGSIVTHNIMSTGDSVSIRNAPNGSVITRVNRGETMLRIELASSQVAGHYWDKIVLDDGTKGYMARDYIELINLYTNCNETVFANTAVNLRNGPGTSGTSVVTTLVQGQMVTKIETGMYNGVDGYDWDRVTLSDGRGGYVASQYLSAQGEAGAVTSEIIKVICNSGLKVREQPGTGQKVLTYLDKNETATRTEAGASNANGYTWDKIVTNDGIEGYIARGDSREQYIEVVQEASGNTPSPSTPNNEIKIEDTKVICEPKTTIESIKEKYTDTAITVKNANGEVVNSGNVGTGYKITISGKEYTVVKLGDSNGDGKITPADSTIILRAYVGLNQIGDDVKLASDTNKDGKVTPADSTVILRAYVGLTVIEI